MAMLKIIVGEKGTGKTKTLIDAVHAALDSQKGSIVFINKGTRHTYDLSSKIRLINTEDYAVENYDAFYGVICGVLSQRNMFVNAAKEMLKVDDAERAVELLDMCQECVPAENFPLDITYLGFSNEYMVLEMIETYFMAGADEKALELARRFEDELFVSTEFFLMNYDDLKREFDACYNCISYIAELADHFGYKDYGEEVRKRFNDLLGVEEE